MILHDVIGGTPDWEALRVGIVTASEVSNIITPKTMKLSASAEPYANLKAAERILKRKVQKFQGNYYTERGHELEPDAIKLYEMQHNCDCSHGGFITNDAGTMGCSPDAVIGLARGLELKCPEADTHVGYLCAGTLPEAYKCQVQSSLFVTGWKAWDFMSYYPELPPFECEVLPDLEFHAALEKALAEFEAIVQRKLEKIRGGQEPCPACSKTTT